jgi:hypothetical protein
MPLKDDHPDLLLVEELVYKPSGPVLLGIKRKILKRRKCKLGNYNILF